MPIKEIIDRLRDGASDDIWYDADDYDDDSAGKAIELTQEAMQRAADLLEKALLLFTVVTDNPQE